MKDTWYLQILDIKVITINILFKQLNKLPSLHLTTVQKTKVNKAKTPHNMSWTPLCASKRN